MSLVGTRPPTLDEWEQYEPHHRARMAFRPGVTGMWQVSGRSNITDLGNWIRQHKKTLSRVWLSHRGFMKMKYHPEIQGV